MTKLKKDGTPSKQGEGGGKPPKYNSEIELDKKCKNYFIECIKNPEMPSKAGLRVFLKLDKSSFSDYKKKYPYPIKKAEDLIEKAWTQRLAGPNATGAIFYLKNAFKEDFKDRYNTDITSGGKQIIGITYVKPQREDTKNKANDKAGQGVGEVA